MCEKCWLFDKVSPIYMIKNIYSPQTTYIINFPYVFCHNVDTSGSIEPIEGVLKYGIRGCMQHKIITAHVQTQ